MTSEEIIARQGEIEERKAQIDADLENPEADLDALNEEARKLAEESEQLTARLDELKAKAAEEEETRRKIAAGEIGETKEKHEEAKTMTELEIRSSAEYSEAYKQYIISGDDKECRTLLSVNATAATGYVPVPTYVDDMIKTAWESNELLNRVTKTFFKGNVKVPFERSADGAYVHSEGTTGLTEEDLKIGLVELKPENIKKWIKISDEAVALGGEAFVRYIYNELIYRVLNKLVPKRAGILSGPCSSGKTNLGIPLPSGSLD